MSTYLLVAISVVLNIALAAALLFKSALNQIVIDWHQRFQERREHRRRLLLELHEHMSLFDARYMVLAARTLLDAAVPDLDAERASVVRAVSAQLNERFLKPFQVSLDFVHRHETRNAHEDQGLYRPVARRDEGP